MTQNDARPARAVTSIDVVVAALYAAAIFVLGSLPGAVAIAKNVSDKLQHAVGFALLAWLWCRALRRLLPGWALPRVMAGSAALSVGLGGALELWQGLLAYRSCDVLDWAADAVGAAIGVGFYAAFAAASAPPRAAE